MVKYIKSIMVFIPLLATVGSLFIQFPASISKVYNTQIVYASDVSDVWGILEEVIAPSKDQKRVLDPGNTPNAVGNRIFRGSVQIKGEDGKIKFIQEVPLFVRITMIILEVAIAIWVTMCILIGIMYALASWDETKQKKLIGYLSNILFGILIALAADVIIVLIRSFSQSTIIS